MDVTSLFAHDIQRSFQVPYFFPDMDQIIAWHTSGDGEFAFGRRECPSPCVSLSFQIPGELVLGLTSATLAYSIGYFKKATPWPNETNAEIR